MIEVAPIENAAAWDALLQRWPRPHVLQSWLWGMCKAQTGWRAARWRIGPADRPLAAAAMLTRRLGRLPFAVAYVPKGPTLDWSDDAAVDAALASIERTARRQGALFVKIDPDVPADAAYAPAVQRTLQTRGWRPSSEQIQFRNTMLIDLIDEEEALLARMKPKWRYNIRLASRRGVQVRAGGPEDLATFYALYAETSARDGFLIRPYPYYRTIWEAFLGTGQGHLLLAAAEGQIIAGVFLLRFGPTAWYFYGASSARGRNLMPNHLLQWEAMRWARAQGCTVYDLWGAPDTLSEQDPLWGVYHFKEGFGGRFTAWLGAWDYAVTRAGYWLYTTVMPRLLDLMRRRSKRAAIASE